MTQIENDMLCKYCFGCEKLNNNFNGARNCKNFIPAYKNWREEFEKALKTKEGEKKWLK